MLSSAQAAAYPVSAKAVQGIAGNKNNPTLSTEVCNVMACLFILVSFRSLFYILLGSRYHHQHLQDRAA